MKKIRTIICVIGSSLLIMCLVLIGIHSLQKEEWEGLDVINVACSKRLCNSLSEVEGEATIIVEVEVGEVLDQKVSSFYDATFQKELPSAGYTRRELIIEKVYQGEKSIGDKIVLLHDYFIWENTDNTKQLISLSGYKPMKKGDKYLLFLAWDESKDGYYVIGDYQGIYPVEETVVSKKGTSNTVKQDFAHVYSNEEYSFTLVPIYEEVREKYFEN